MPLVVVEGGLHCFEGDALARNVHDWGTSVLCSASADLLCCLVEEPRYYLQSIDRYRFLCLSFLFLFVILERDKGSC